MKYLLVLMFLDPKAEHYVWHEEACVRCAASNILQPCIVINKSGSGKRKPGQSATADLTKCLGCQGDHEPCDAPGWHGVSSRGSARLSNRADISLREWNIFQRSREEPRTRPFRFSMGVKSWTSRVQRLDPLCTTAHHERLCSNEIPPSSFSYTSIIVGDLRACHVLVDKARPPATLGRLSPVDDDDDAEGPAGTKRRHVGTNKVSSFWFVRPIR